MQLPLKLALLSIAAIALALGLVAATVQHQTLELAHQERELVETAYLHSKETELRHYVQLATTALTRIKSSGEEQSVQRRQALEMLSRMQFGEDGYFFVYDEHGNVLLDARQMGLSGVDLCDPNSPGGAGPARIILDAARSGGGLVRYQWQKPSSLRTEAKLAYVATVPEWGWSLGTGLYLDDVEQALRQIDESAQANIAATRWRIFGIAALCIVLIGVAGLVFNLSDHRVSSNKLQRLAQRVVHSQEEERTRVARDLHDGVVLWTSPDGKMETGIWECTPGRFTADRSEIAEICHILTGRVSLHNADGTSREIGAGEMFVLPLGWRGEWTIHERTRKIYTMVAKGV